MIYFIQAGKSGPIKIGFTDSSIENRLRELQTSCPYELDLLGVIPGDVAKEKELHEKFANYHIRGEWFNPNIELRTFIFENTKESIEIPDHEALNTFVNLDEILGVVEYNYIKKALELADNNKVKAAEMLGLSFRSFRYRLNKYE